MNRIICSHPQLHRLGCASFGIYVIESNEKNVRSYSSMAPIDEFFSQPHNLVGGCVDTSPNAVSTVQGASHVSPVSPEKPLPKGLTDKDIHDMVISKHCQSLAETSQLRRLRPNKEDYEDLSGVHDHEQVEQPNTVES